VSANKGYYELPHTADLALHLSGSSYQELLVNAALGLAELMQCYAEPGATLTEHKLELDCPDAESLLIDWLNELIYLVTAKATCLERFEVTSLTASSLRATVFGRVPGHFNRYIKAATFHELSLDYRSGCQTTVVFDV